MVKIKEPTIDYPNWLPKEVRKAVEIYIKQRVEYANRYHNLFPTYWEKERANINKISNAFTNSSASTTWSKLLKKSPDKTIKFVTALFHINHEREFESITVDNFAKEKESYVDVYKKCKEFIYALHKHNEEYDGGLLGDYYKDIMPLLDNFLTMSHQHFCDFNEYVEHSSKKENSLIAESRKKHSKKADAIYFIRRISAFFRTEFGKPMNAEIAELIQAIFDIQEYDEDNIKKLTKDVKNIISKREHSAK